MDQGILKGVLEWVLILQPGFLTDGKERGAVRESAENGVLESAGTVSRRDVGAWISRCLMEGEEEGKRRKGKIVVAY